MGCCGKHRHVRAKPKLGILLEQFHAFKSGGIVMRDSCKLCACKHISQARVLLTESLTGYPEHYWFAMGHLAEAEAELTKEHVDLANQVREERLRLENDRKYEIPFATLVNTICPPPEQDEE